MPYDSPTGRSVELVVAELCANAVRHGCVPGRDFELRLDVVDAAVRIEVSDARDERFPPHTVEQPAAVAVHGYGLFLVANLAARWGTAARYPLGKTVWAEVEL